MEKKAVIKSQEPEVYVRISRATLRNMEREGLATPYRMPGDHRRCCLDAVHVYLGSCPTPSAVADLTPI
jgi:hypothetical protein